MTDNTPPVTLTIVESRPNWLLLVTYNDDNSSVAYILSFHLHLQAAIDAGYAYLYTGQTTGNYPKPREGYSLRNSGQKSHNTHTNVALSDEAWEWFTTQTRLHKYHGRASYLGMGSFILALLDANPNPEDWTDNRPVAEPDLPELNDFRVSQNQLPFWKDDEFNNNRDYRGYRRTGRTLPAKKVAAILERLEPIAWHHKITPTFEQRDLLNKRRWASAALEAIGLQYLVPKNPPRPNLMPPKRDRTGHNNAQKSDERFGFF